MAQYHRYIKGMYEQFTKLDRIEERRLDILDVVDEMPAFHIKANQADADIQQLKNQNLLLHDEVKVLKNELATRPTLAILKQEINKYSSGGKLTSSATSSGLQGLPKLDKLEPKIFRAFRTQFKHFAAVSNWSPDQEALHLRLALPQNISNEMMRCVRSAV